MAPLMSENDPNDTLLVPGRAKSVANNPHINSILKKSSICGRFQRQIQVLKKEIVKAGNRAEKLKLDLAKMHKYVKLLKHRVNLINGAFPNPDVEQASTQTQTTGEAENQIFRYLINNQVLNHTFYPVIDRELLDIFCVRNLDISLPFRTSLGLEDHYQCEEVKSETEQEDDEQPEVSTIGQGVSSEPSSVEFMPLLKQFIVHRPSVEVKSSDSEETASTNDEKPSTSGKHPSDKEKPPVYKGKIVESEEMTGFDIVAQRYALLDDIHLRMPEYNQEDYKRKFQEFVGLVGDDMSWPVAKETLKELNRTHSCPNLTGAMENPLLFTFKFLNSLKAKMFCSLLYVSDSKDLMAKVVELETALTKVQDLKKILNTSSKKYEEQLVRKQNKITKFKTAEKELQKMIQLKNEEISSFKVELEKQVKQLQRLTSKDKKIVQELKRRNDEVRQLTEELEKTKESKQRKSCDLQRLTQQLDKTQESSSIEVRQLKRQLQKLQNELRTLKAQPQPGPSTSFSPERRWKETIVHDTSRQLQQSAESEAGAGGKRPLDYKAKVEELTTKNKQLQESHATMINEYNALNQEREKYKAKYSELKANTPKLHERISYLKAKLKKYGDQSP